jgi:phage terminase small subunit
MGRSADAPLTEKQKAFVDAYFNEAGDAYRAYRIAYDKPPGGSALKTSHTVFHNPKVQREIQRRRKALGKADIKAGRDKRKLLWQLVDRCMQAEQVLNKRGEPTGKWKFDSAGANRALETLCKMDGEFEKDNEQKKMNLTVEVVRFADSVAE